MKKIILSILMTLLLASSVLGWNPIFPPIVPPDMPAQWQPLADQQLANTATDTENTVVYQDIFSYCSDADDPEFITITSTHDSYSLSILNKDIVINQLQAGYTGTETVKLSCNGIPASFQLTIYSPVIPNQAPVAEAGSDQTVSAYEAVVFDGSNSSDVDGTITSYHWDFGDGETADGVIVSHVYNEHGTFTVTLTVTDDDSATGTDTATIIADGVPTAVIGGPYYGYTDQYVEFDASQSSDDGSIVLYHWNWGDGWLTDTTGPIAYHLYEEAGEYAVTLTVTDNNDLESSDTTTAYIKENDSENQIPDAGFRYSPLYPAVGETVSFTDLSTDEDGYILVWFWDFGDGRFSLNQNPAHQYTRAGTYQVTLMVVDNEGAYSTQTQTLVVDEEVQPAALPAQRTVFSHIRFNDYAQAGEAFDIDAALFNDGSLELEDVHVTAYLFGLEELQTVGPFDVEDGETETAHFHLEIPSDAQPGTYDLRLTASNDHFRHNEHRTITIV